MDTDTIQEQHYEPQAFIADPERAWDMVEVTKGQLEALRSGDQATWDDLAKDFDPAGIGKEQGQSESKKEKKKSTGYLKEIEPSRANQEAWDQARSIWEKTGAIKPPFEKDLLCRIARTSGVLQECIQTYITVIEGFGYTFKPMLDPDADDAYEQVKLTMWNRRVESGGLPELTEPTDEEVKQELKNIRRDIKFQKLRAERFFRNAGRINGEPVGFTSLRQRIRDDIERTGEWYWEVLEDENGNPRRLNFLPSVGMRKMPLEEKQIKVSAKERVDDFTIVEVDEWRKFRRFIQVDPDLRTEAYFKELGDPRVLSSKSGKFYKTELELGMEEPGVAPATCVITHGIPDSETPYGIPRWIANSPAIGGSRKAEEVNFSYFDNKTIPPFIILVSGGRLSSKAQDRIKIYLRSLKGSENFHKLLVLEAAPFAANMPGQPPQRVQIEVVPLIKFLKDDGLFLKYLEFNDTRIGANFACPPLLRGRSSEYTRACYDENTETLTENGWKFWDEIEEGEKIATLNPKTDFLEYHEPIGGIYLYDYEGPMLHFKNRFTDVCVTPEHDMWLRTASKNSFYKKIKAQDIEYERFFFRTAPDGFEPIETPEFFEVPEMVLESGRNAGIRPSVKIPYDLWIRFVCAYSSDGATSPEFVRGKKRNMYNITMGALKKRKISMFYEIYQEMKNLGFNVFEISKESNGKTVFSMADKVLWRILRDTCGTKAENKKLPPEFVHLPKNYLDLALSVLKNTDGTKGKTENNWNYSSSSKDFAEQVQIMALHSGNRASVVFSDSNNPNRKRNYRVLITEGKREHRVYGSSVEEVDYSGKVYCFEVPGHLFFTRRNGKVTVQGNTARETLRFFEKMVAQPERTKFDEIINTKILPELGLTLVRFESLGADTSDPEVVAKVLDVLLNHGALLPVDGRQEAEKLLRRELPKVDEDFMKKPLKLSVVEVSTRGSLPRDALEDELNEEEESQPEQTEVQQTVELAGAYMKKLSKSLKEDVLFDLKGLGRENTWIGIDEEEN